MYISVSAFCASLSRRQSMLYSTVHEHFTPGNQNYAPAHENKTVLKYFWDLTLSRRCSVEGHNDSLEINYACGIKLKLSKSIILRYCNVKKNKIKEELLQNMPPHFFLNIIRSFTFISLCEWVSHFSIRCSGCDPLPWTRWIKLDIT